MRPSVPLPPLRLRACYVPRFAPFAPLRPRRRIDVGRRRPPRPRLNGHGHRQHRAGQKTPAHRRQSVKPLRSASAPFAVRMNQRLARQPRRLHYARRTLIDRRPASRPSRVDVMPDCAPFTRPSTARYRYGRVNGPLRRAIRHYVKSTDAPAGAGTRTPYPYARLAAARTCYGTLRRVKEGLIDGFAERQKEELLTCLRHEQRSATKSDNQVVSFDVR